MNSIREAGHDQQIDPLLKSLVAEAAANIRARHRGEATPAPEPLPKHIYDGPKYDGKQCAVCQRHFKTSAEYVTCRLCKSNICRRKGDCKSLHHAAHRLAAKKTSASLLGDGQIRGGHTEPLKIGSNETDVRLGAVIVDTGDLVDAVRSDAPNLVADPQDAGRGSLPLRDHDKRLSPADVDQARPSDSAASLDGDALSAKVVIGEAQVDLAGPVAAQLATEAALDHEIVLGKGIDASGDVARTALAADDVVRRLDLPLLAEVHTHDASFYGENKANEITTHSEPLRGRIDPSFAKFYRGGAA